MRLVEIARYPVKSLQGERLAAGEIEPDGLRGDRRWGIRDETTGKVLTARRAPTLLFASAALAPDGTPLITLPTGVTCAGPGADTDAALSRWLEKPVRLVPSADAPAARAEFFADATDDASEAIEWTMPAGRFVDAQPLLVVTTASLRTAAALHPHGDWDLRRFRANLVIDAGGDGWLEDAWCGTAALRIGAVRLHPEEPCVRCTMVTRPQPGLGEDRDLFRVLARHHAGHFGVWTSVEVTGTVTAGDPVGVEDRAAWPSPDPLVVAPRSSGESEVEPLELAE
ncbi:MAG TPA: MOSC N-terminal beta barrel domain-containing protein [Mycobacteriales bacterium]|nr:MOSC N-terminal beta barrel domain-containing protein [Mycobacteriales bacterium]